ncbi:diaminopimelate decarboxylase [Helicobacter sp. MIT 03-1614]|jgi:diaminopimelate decarboxylase|uniref:Diaminopimelate decarboxylase n=1 Tax=Helicobacter hepaticus (strain ATCC 51449 / 3B1) TaxID=235279 RepID=Q7VG17_HELHP|nr:MULTISPECIES: diaminopimelate decarboxylase [Helicobacter]AAP78104.1 diaminopimelate decarboxylase [Helicobacter hepaticus ATCC 51449]TLD89023.1 diaminopimelate decarboxylase [Helicobacter sp. MIT 03-1614]
MEQTHYFALADTYQTPLYVYDLERITQAFCAIKDAFKARKSLICYALKANSNLSIIHHLAQLGSGADCVSIGEVRRALRAGIPKYKIIFSGVGKQDNEIEEALQSDILFLNVESEEELLRIESIAKKLDKIARISVRVNPNIDAKTHPYISTGLNENKFGVDIEQAKSMYIFAKNAQFLEPIGIHFHIGSQITDLEPIKQSAQKIAQLTHSLLALKIDLKFFDIGGGIGIRYTDESLINPYDYAQAILEALYGLDLTIICEPGRFLVGESGVLLTRVLYEKHNGHKRFVIVDAAMNDLMRPALYRATHQVEYFLKDKRVDSSLESSLCDIVGPICESSDYLAKNIKLPPLQAGDVLVLKNAGAYGYSMASNYNTRPRPAEVALMQGNARLIKHRESFEKMIEDEERLLEDTLEMPLQSEDGENP